MQDRICKRVEEYELQDNESYFDQSCGSTHLLSVVKVNHTDYVNLLNPKGCRSFVNRVADLQARLSKLSSPSEAMVLASSADVFAQDLEVLWTSVDSEVQMAYNKILQDGAPLSYPCLVRRADLKGFLKSGELNSLKEIRIEALKIKKMASEKYL